MRVVETVFASHCPFGLYTFTFHLPDHLVDDSERFERISFEDARPFEHFNGFINQSCRMKS